MHKLPLAFVESNPPSALGGHPLLKGEPFSSSFNKGGVEERDGGFFETAWILCLVISFFLASSLISLAQEFKPLENPDELITGLSKQAEIKTFQAKFVESKSISFVEGILESKGVVAFSNEGNIRWEYNEPKASIMVITPDKTTLSENGKTKDLKGIGGIMKKIKELIGGCITGEILQDKNYKSSFVQSESEYRVELVPLQKRVKQMAEVIQVDFTKETMLINSVLMLDPSGDQTTISFDNLKVNEKLPSDVFNLN
ncbi:MAG: outer membrane lipoprotein-sorting protein [Granulosicoccus sp.]|jgi:outer membrane lipoprotein-sorting protein